MNSVAEITPKIDQLEAALLQHPAVDIEGKRTCRLREWLAPGVYCREVWRPAGTFIIGHAHKTSHLNAITTGRINVFMDGKVVQHKAGDVFMSEAGVRKMTYCPADCTEGATLLTIHATTQTDLSKMEDELVTKSEAFKSLEIEAARKLLSIT